MKTLIIVLFAILLSSCTTYKVKKEIDPNTGISSTEIKVKSTRDLEEPELHYERIGNDAVFDFSAASVDNNSEAFLNAFGSMMQILQAQPVTP
jgi:hypothetical protein